MSGKKWTSKMERELAFQCYAANASLNRIARSFGVSIWTVKYWRVRDAWIERSKLVDEVCREMWREKIEPWLETIERASNGLPSTGSNKRDKIQKDQAMEKPDNNTNCRHREHRDKAGANTDLPNKKVGLLAEREASEKANQDEDERYKRGDPKCVEP